MLDPLQKRILKALQSADTSHATKERLSELSDQYIVRVKLSHGPDESRSLHHCEERKKVAAKIEAILNPDLECCGK